MQEKDFIKVGLLSFLMILIIAAMIIWKSGMFLKNNSYEIAGEFESISGLLPGSEIRYRGYKIGAVSRIEPKPSTIYVYCLIDDQVKIPAGSELEIVFDGLIGEKYISIIPNETSEGYVNANELLHGKSSFGLSNFMNVGTQALIEAKKILESINNIIGNDETQKSISGTIEKIGLFVTKINYIADDIRAITKRDELDKTFENLYAISESLKNGSQSLIDQGNFGENLAIVVENLKDITNSLKENLVTDNTYERINGILVNLDEFSTKLNTLISDEEFNQGVPTSNYRHKRTKSLVRTVTEVKVRAENDLYYSAQQGQAYYFIQSDLVFPDYFYRIGGGEFNGKKGLLTLQQGLTLWDKYVLRFGIHYFEPGVGLDYQINDRNKIMFDMYDIHSPAFAMSYKFIYIEQLDFNLTLLRSYRQLEAQQDPFTDILFGISYHL